MTVALALLLLAQTSGADGAQPADCHAGRLDEGPQYCEVERRFHDVLDADSRPAARALGAEAIRFSGQASAGFDARLVEVLARADGRAQGRLYLYRGHWRSGWERRTSRRFSMSAAAYRRFAAEVDRALASYRAPRAHSMDAPGEGIIVCTDGPAFLTERVRAANSRH